MEKKRTEYLQRATLTITVPSKDLIKIQKVIDYTKSIGADVSYKSLKSVSR